MYASMSKRFYLTHETCKIRLKGLQKKNKQPGFELFAESAFRRGERFDELFLGGKKESKTTKR